MEELHNRDSDPEFEEMKTQMTKDILADLSYDKIHNDPILRGFWRLHEAVGRSSNKHISSRENLLNYMMQTGHLPHVNLLVDIYNFILVKTHLALGAHDIAHVSGNIHLRYTSETESFLPLCYAKPQLVGPGEYAYIDDNNKIICRLEVRQVEKTNITMATTECFGV